jgi:hypothetical protein
MQILPDWNSVESTSRRSDILFWAGIVCLVLLAATEVASHVYSHRSGFLSKEAARQDEAQRNQEQQKERDAATREASEIEYLRSQLAEADKKVGDLEAKQPERRLTEPEKVTLTNALRPFAGQKIIIECIWGDVYGKELADDFFSVMKDANWDPGKDITQATFNGPDPEGITVVINTDDFAARNAPPGVIILVRTLADLHLIAQAAVEGDKSVIGGQALVLIGKKIPAAPQ